MWRRVTRSAGAGSGRGFPNSRMGRGGVYHSRVRGDSESIREVRRVLASAKTRGGSMRRFVTGIAFLLLAALSGAQTTGDMVGRVTDEQGGVLPGVTVEARSPALQGVRSGVTDAAGAYRLSLLPPGAYRVTVTLPGFARAEETVTVALAKTATAD